MLNKPEDLKGTKKCIYKVLCQCWKTYVDENKRPLEVRITEHRRTRMDRASRHRMERHKDYPQGGALVQEKVERGSAVGRPQCIKQSQHHVEKHVAVDHQQAFKRELTDL